ncbi:hypothetical protein BT96DRAFT_995556 [Gymnopus androsaceus JB14]|uniref:DNA 3'-5' helicase n=1 Tax=Gymnopus androsaceus JB14 TaxID=1447944 RepID=A0A6A4HJN7_9AGAR|nr:hypothetical protein BT96DRAFT_995556 [Gymnopus androsaceus JB14]
MSSNVAFTSIEGINTVNSIVKKLIPKWKDGLRKIQLFLYRKILNLKDVFAIEATGGGKSALFGIPVLVHLKISQNPSLYPKFTVPICSDPIGVVVTPTKGLASNIVKQLKKDFNIDAFAYTSENLSAKQNAGANIIKEITSCQYHIICVDPEHLREWECLVLLLISVCTTLGFSGSQFHLIRQSNERPNTKIIVHTLTSAIGGTEFPQLIPYLNQRRKTVIHVRTIDLGYSNLHVSIQTNSCIFEPSTTYNEKTIELLDSDPRCQIVIATKALSLGIHAEELRDSIAVGTSDTQDNRKQDGGRAGWKEGVIACRIIFTTTTELNKVNKIVKASGEVSVAAVSKVKQTMKAKKEMKRLLDPAKVVFLSEQFCRVACKNVIYDNPPIETSCMDCIQANCPIPCDLCSSRYHILETKFPPSNDKTALPPFILPETTTKKRKPRKKADKLKENELEEAKLALITYEQLYAEERLVAPHRYRPRSLYFPKALWDAIAVELLKIKSQAMLNVILASNEWSFIESQGSNLFELISSLQTTLLSRHRKSKPKKSTKKSREVSELLDGLSDVDEFVESTLPAKQAPLVPAENQPHAK